MNDGIVWGDPPLSSKGRNHGETKKFVGALKNRPGEWAKYPHTVKSPSTATHNRRRFPGTDWTTRGRPDGQFDVYGRYVGGSD